MVRYYDHPELLLPDGPAWRRRKVSVRCRKSKRNRHRCHCVMPFCSETLSVVPSVKAKTGETWHSHSRIPGDGILVMLIHPISSALSALGRPVTWPFQRPPACDSPSASRLPFGATGQDLHGFRRPPCHYIARMAIDRTLARSRRNWHHSFQVTRSSVATSHAAGRLRLPWKSSVVIFCMHDLI